MNGATVYVAVVIAGSSFFVLGSATAAESFRDCATCPEMTMVGPGRFVMGSPEDERDRSPDESPQHIVHFTSAFAIGRYEVTHEQFDAFVKATGRPMEPCFYEPGFLEPNVTYTPDHPALCMTWDDAQAYVAWLSQRTGKPYRLPSEAEWEYAARGGNQASSYQTFSFGNVMKDLCRSANSTDTVCDDGYPGTAPVGSFEPNALGLYDIHGNVWEMTEDCITDTYDSAPSDGAKVTAGDCSKRIIRGGGWSNRAYHLRSANRGWLGGNLRDVLTGLRVVRSLP